MSLIELYDRFSYMDVGRCCYQYAIGWKSRIRSVRDMESTPAEYRGRTDSDR